MIIFKSVKWKNFLSTGNTFTTIDLDRQPTTLIVGDDGAGKSTTIGIICSLINKTAGKVEIFGKDIDHDFTQAKKMIGLVPQEFNFNSFEPIEEIIAHQAGYYGIHRKLAKERTEFNLNLLGLWEKRRSLSLIHI